MGTVLPVWETVVLAFLVDLAVGDPRWLSHPTVLMGKGITLFEKAAGSLLDGRRHPDGEPRPDHLLYGKSRADDRSRPDNRRAKRVAGVLLVVVIVGGSYLATAGLLRLAAKAGGGFAAALGVWLMSTTIAARGLAGAGLEIARFLAGGDLETSRAKLAWIVGRDTRELTPEEVVRAVVETVAENTVDGVTAPLLYGLVGGAPLAMAYRAVNTLDSMVGYRNEKYADFGWAAARFDDLVNYIPARLTAAALVLAAALDNRGWRKTARAIWRDGRKHPSPNSGLMEAGVAGALGVRLGGTNYYQGVPSFRPYLGEESTPLAAPCIREAVVLMAITSVLVLIMGVFLRAMLG
ncbi:MAG: adenosylcobinamide-phosphate synthase CbiB [Firmicutes bacterium]|nr:adenosylcobinamide-phosphate synthase CbiB [Bacillota bacterium]